MSYEKMKLIVGTPGNDANSIKLQKKLMVALRKCNKTDIETCINQGAAISFSLVIFALENGYYDLADFFLQRLLKPNTSIGGFEVIEEYELVTDTVQVAKTVNLLNDKIKNNPDDTFLSNMKQLLRTECLRLLMAIQIESKAAIPSIKPKFFDRLKLAATYDVDTFERYMADLPLEPCYQSMHQDCAWISKSKKTLVRYSDLARHTNNPTSSTPYFSSKFRTQFLKDRSFEISEAIKSLKNNNPDIPHNSTTTYSLDS